MITKLEKSMVQIYIKQNLELYKRFMKIDQMPEFDVQLMEINLDDSNKKGYGVVASHTYNVETNKHQLKVWKDIYKRDLNADYILFHEFTHMHDTDTYSANNKILYAANRGYTEYHASQVELLKLVGVESIERKIAFSLTDSIKTISGSTSILEYIITPYQTVTEIIIKPNFPQNIEELSVVLGMLFNHLGRVAICEMFASDYEEYKNKLEVKPFQKPFIDKALLDLNPLMKGFLVQPNIIYLAKIHFNLIGELIKKIDSKP